MNKTFNLHKLLRDVFAPDERDRALVMVDLPLRPEDDTEDWRERRRMAEEWLEGFSAIGISTLPFMTYAVTKGNNADLPETGIQNGETVRMEEAVASATIVVAMTKNSATAPLSMMTLKYPNLRVASMPDVLRRMESSALSADYNEVARKANLLADLLNRSDFADVNFSTGHTFRFDLRHRVAHADDGMCRPDKRGFKLINLPSGEAFSVPYEGEKEGDPSQTEGRIPLHWKGHLYELQVERNRICCIRGEGPDRKWLEDHFSVDKARRNIAELGLGCNDRAIITGNVLEDEKAGFHWAYGRSEHLGGTVGPGAFTDPSHVVHHDVVYAKGCPIEIKLLELIDASDTRQTVIRDGVYTEPFA